jgi:hypothetical protein
MGREEELGRGLAKVSNLRERRGVEGRVGSFESLQVDGIVVSQVEKDIASAHGGREGGGNLRPEGRAQGGGGGGRGEEGRALFIAKDEVDPVVEMSADKLTFQCLAMHAHKIIHTPMGPWRKFHVPDFFPTLGPAQCDPIHVRQEFGEAKQFRDELLHVVGVGHTTLVGGAEGAELPVGQIEMSRVKFPMEGSERFQAEEIPKDKRRIRVMGSVVERREGRPTITRQARLSISLPKGRVTVLEPLTGRFGLGPHRPFQIPKRVRVVQIQNLRGVVGQDPGKDGVLRQIVKSPPRRRVHAG